MVPSTLHMGDGTIIRNNAIIITTVAGKGTGGFSGDGGPATEAAFGSTHRIAVDAAGNIYVADWNNHRIRKVDTNGIVTTIAGSGGTGYLQGGFGGDGGLATEARLKYPADVAVDSSGNIYIVDSNNARIRKVDSSGIITTVAGRGRWGSGGDGGPATQADFQSPSTVNVDSSGNIYITDNYSFRIRKVDTNGIITTEDGKLTYGKLGYEDPAKEEQ
jgi:hypothetical protein